MKMTATTFLRYGFLLLLAAGEFSCKKFVSVPLPVNQLNAGEVFTDDKTATAAVVGIYSEMEFTLPVSTFLTVLPGLSADEFTYTSGDVEYFEMATNTYLPDHPYIADFWSTYSTIYTANACIQGIQKSTGLSPATKSQLLGEALFSRAFCYFYLVNLFGDVPLVTSTDYRINDTLRRTASTLVYQQVIADLETAQNLMSSDYQTAQRVRPNSGTAAALLSRVYLYNSRWQDAESQASSIINSGLYSLSGLDSVFLNFSSETIWQLMPIIPSFNTQEAPTFFPIAPTAIPTFPLTGDLVAAFEPGDKRLSAWTGNNNIGGQLFYYPAKYKNLGGGPVTEYHILFRLAEQYLIRAEARMEQGNISGAVDDLNTIRSRTGLAALPANLTPDAATAAIQQERRIELFAELGHRWLDLKRTSRVSAVIGALKPGTWTPAAALWPIPQSEISANPNLTQNTGY
jgi:starch-binding outer membrane protein, SusD/RagB family